MKCVVAMLLMLGAVGLSFSSGAVTPMISAGGDHACAVTQGGGLKCWGGNAFGELGDGTTSRRDQPQDVPGLTQGVNMVAVGLFHTCALTTAGGVKCWGYNFDGQLGDGTNLDRLTPADVFGLSSGVTAIAAGDNHSCALLVGGGVKCWGSNSNGRLGDAGTANQNVPVDVSGLSSGVAAIAAGGSGGCAIMSSGALKCWGSRVGDGTTATRRVPTDVTGLASGVIAVAVGLSGRCALLIGGALKCWASNSSGAVGDGTTTSRTVPTDVSGLQSGVTAVATTRGGGACAIVNGGVMCWGRNPLGAVGNGTTIDQLLPVPVIGFSSGASALAAGTWFVCGLTTGGSVRCWGDNSNGALGDAMPGWRTTPRDVVLLGSGVIDVAVGGFHTCAATASGAAKCWGSANNGAVGDGSSVPSRAVPVDVVGLGSGVTRVAASFFHSCALSTSGSVWCWGQNSDGRLGDGTTVNRLTPVAVTGLSAGASTISVGVFHGCALVGGGLKCWGNNANGQLGDGSLVQRLTPVDVSANGKVFTTVSAGDFLTCAVSSTGGATCWGENSFGQVGDGTNTARTTPTDVSGLTTGVQAVAAGGSFSCALTSAGGVKCWGDNSAGQLGDGTLTSRNVPGDVSGLTVGVLRIGAGSAQACAVLTTGAVKCWGFNPVGQLGDGTRIDRSTPVDVALSGSAASAISLGYQHSCALLTNGGLKCWGSNGAGQVGDGTVGFRSTATVYTAAPSLSQPLAVADGATVTARVDGAMIARYLAGLSGSAVTQGIDTTGALRTDATEVARYFETIRPLLDIDGNTEFNPLTDGLLVVRYLLGMRGSALVAGAVGNGATRSAAQIEAYLAVLLP